MDSLYQIQWDVKIESELKASHEIGASKFVQDKYVMALKYNDLTVLPIPKSLSKISYFIGNPGEIFSWKQLEKEDFHTTLIKGGMDLPATYIYRSVYIDINAKLLILVGETIGVCNKANNKEKTKLNTKIEEQKRHFKKIGLEDIKYFFKGKKFVK